MEPDDDGDRPGDRRIDRRRPRVWADEKWASERNGADRLSSDDIYALRKSLERERDRVAWYGNLSRIRRDFVAGLLGAFVLNGPSQFWRDLWEVVRRWLHSLTG